MKRQREEDEASSSQPWRSQRKLREHFSLGEALTVVENLMSSYVEIEMPVHREQIHNRLGVVDQGLCESANFLDADQLVAEKEIKLRKMGSENIAVVRKEAKDMNGHGTVCASVASNTLPDEVKFGPLKFPTTTTPGDLPIPKIGIYKANKDQITDAVVEAINDKVEVLAMPRGPTKYHNHTGDNLFTDVYSEAAFVAMANNVLPCCAAGNMRDKIVMNVAPWMLTCGSCTSKLEITTRLIRGDEQDAPMTVQGSINVHPNTKFCQLVDIQDVIIPGTNKLREDIVAGKIVIMDAMNKYGVDEEAKIAGAVGIIVVNCSESPFTSFMHPIPAIVVDEHTGLMLRDYLTESGDEAVVMIEQSKVTVNEGLKTAVAHFSSKGSHPWSPYFIKPDVLAKGMEVVCAVRQGEKKPKQQKCTISEGTSLSTPLAALAVACVRFHYPTLSASAVKSAVMTSATRVTDENERTVRGSGCGEINIGRALNPLLVYDIPFGDYCRYIRFSEGCPPSVQGMMKEHCGTTKFVRLEPWNLNYPSFRAPVPDETREWDFERTFTYVGKEPEETFTSHVRCDEGLELFVDPPTHTFDGPGKTGKYTVHAKVNAWSNESDGRLTGDVVWISSGGVEVRSPVEIVRKQE